MAPRTPQTYLALAEAAWRWVLDQVRWTDGPWIPEVVTGSEITGVPNFRDGTHSGVGGLAQVLAEIRRIRPWSAEETSVAAAIGERVSASIPTEVDCTFFDGLVSVIGVLTALDPVEVAGVDQAVDRLIALATPDGWPQTVLGPPRFQPDTRINDLTLGTAGVLLGALWARRMGADNGADLGERAAAVLMAEVEPVPAGANWRFVPTRFRTDDGRQMPNLSHGLAGIAAVLALAGSELDHPDLTHAAVLGAEHLVTIGRSDGRGFLVPRHPAEGAGDEEEFTHNWCHGGAGTSLLFLALDRAGVGEIAGVPPLTWHRRCLRGVRTSGVPDRLRPGFWDNDGRCCGTAGVGEVFLDSWQRGGEQDDLEFALHLADAIVERAVLDGPHAYWRFTEHREPEPLLPPGVGWMQGAAGIAAFLFRTGRVLRDGPDAEPVPRMDTWWALPVPRA